MAAASDSEAIKEAIKQEINHFIEVGIDGNRGTALEDKKQRESLLEAILNGILIRRTSGSTVDEIQYIKDTLAGIGVSGDKIDQLYANNANPDTVVINVLQEFREEKKRKLDEEERKRQVAATDAENEKKAKDARDAARKKFFEDYRALSQEAAVIRQDISKGQNQLNILQLTEDKINSNIACCEETIADLRAYIAEKQNQLEIKIGEFESEIANFRVDFGKHEKEENESREKLESAQSELEEILAEIRKLEVKKEKSTDPSDLENEIKIQTTEKEAKEAAIASLKEENDIFKKQVDAVKLLIDAKLADIQTERKAFADIKSQVENVISDQEKTLAANHAELANNVTEKQNAQSKLAENTTKAVVVDEEIKIALQARKAEIEALHKNDPEKDKLLAEVELAGLKEEFAKMKAELEVDANNLALQNAMIDQETENLKNQKDKLLEEKDEPRAIALKSQINSGQQALTALQQKQQVLVQKVDSGKLALEAKEREIDGKRPGLPAQSEFSAKDKSENSTITVDSNVTPFISLPTGTTPPIPSSTGQSDPNAKSPTNFSGALASQGKTAVDAGVLTPEEKEIERKWDKLGLPPDLSGSDDSTKAFWLMLFSMLTDVLAKTLAQDRKRVMALWNYAGSQIELHYANKSGDQQRIDAAQKNTNKASQDFKQAFGLPLDEKITRFQIVRAVGSMIPLLSSSTYVQRYALVDVKSKSNSNQNQQNPPGAQLQTPNSNTPNTTQNNPTVTTNNNQNLASNSSTTPTVTANSVSSSTAPTVTTNQLSGQTPTQNTANTNQMSNQSTLTPPPFIPQPPTVPKTILTQVGNTHATNQNDPNNALQQAIAPPPATSSEIVNKPIMYNQPQLLSEMQKNLSDFAKDGRDVSPGEGAINSPPIFNSSDGKTVNDMNKLTELAKQQKQEQEESTQKLTPDSDDNGPESGNNGDNNDTGGMKRSK